MDEVIYGVRVYTCEMALLELLLQGLDTGYVKLSVEEQHRVALVLGSLDIRVLVVLVCSIEVNQVAVLILLGSLDERLILVKGKVFALCILEE